MNLIYEHFKRFSKIPRCSLRAEPMKEYLIEFAKNLNYSVKVDKSGNILCTKENPVLCLQAHYDMVCLADAPNIEVYEENGWIKAKNSTLGADNGIGIAIMLLMMEKFDNIECLFTANEEVGLIGANNLELELNAKYMLNLDSEEEGTIVIGCAGGVNIFGNMKLKYKKCNDDKKTYKIEAFGFAGGHSGMKIADNIPSAIKVLAYELIKIEDCELVSFEGGEVNNSIPKTATAIIKTTKKPEINHQNIKVIEIPNIDKVIEQSSDILGFINSFAQGVRAYNKELNMPNDSINLGTIKIVHDELEIDCFARSMSNEGIDILQLETNSLYKEFGFDVTCKYRSHPWKPEENEFTNIIKEISKKFFDEVKVEAIHAGLECGTIQAKQKKHIDVASIGPNILGAHSLEEKCELASIDRVSKIVEELIIKLSK